MLKPRRQAIRQDQIGKEVLRMAPPRLVPLHVLLPGFHVIVVAKDSMAVGLS